MCDRDDHQDIVIESYAEEDVATYQDRLASFLSKMLEGIRNLWNVT